MKKALSNILFGIGAMGINILFFVGSLIHLWTTIIAYMETGFIGSAITFFLPIIAQIYWFFASVNISGAFINTYSIIIMVYLILWVIVLGITVIGKQEDNN